MFFKRLLTQCILLAGPVLFFLLNQLACVPFKIALIPGILLSAAGWVYGAIVLRCPFCAMPFPCEAFTSTAAPGAERSYSKN